MNELTFKPAASVALYNSRLIIADGDNECFDSHGLIDDSMESMVIPEYEVEGDNLIKLLDGLNMDYFHQKLACKVFDVVQKRFRLLNNSYERISLSIAENGHGGLQIKMDVNCEGRGGENYSELMSYFGPYSIQWRND